MNLSLLRNAGELSAYSESAWIFHREIQATADNFVFKLNNNPERNSNNILKILSILSLARSDILAERIVPKIGIHGELLAWIAKHFGGDSTEFAFLKSHLIKAGFKVPEFLDLPRVQTKFTPTSVAFICRVHVDIYTIDLALEYHTQEALNAVCERRVPQVKYESESIDKLLLLFLFPIRTHVTPVMIHILTKWAMNRAVMTPEEDRLARLIILVDQVAIIKHN